MAETATAEYGIGGWLGVFWLHDREGDDPLGCRRLPDPGSSRSTTPASSRNCCIRTATFPDPGLSATASQRSPNSMPCCRRSMLSLARFPEGPLEDFRAATRDLPQTTGAERLVVQRIGQEVFRDRLLTYWRARCPLTGITDPDMLRASHIIPWKDCPDDADRLNIHNGLLLSALWDAAFDRGW